MNTFWRAKPSEKKQQNLKRWCEETWPMIYRYVYYHVQNREEAEDITQETYTRTLRNFSSPDNLPNDGYLRTVALNLIRDRWRHMKIRGTHVPLEEDMFSSDSVTDSVETQTLVQHLMEKLSEDHRTVLQLRIIQGYSRSDTANHMGRTEDSVRGLQYRAIQSLKSLINKHNEEVGKE